MATYFGEIVEKPSRAFWDDYDSEDDTPLNVPFNRKLEVTQLSNIQEARKDKLFIVISGALAEGFANACVIEGNCTAEIKEIHDNNSCSRKKNTTSTVQHLTDEVSMCICNANLDITQAFDFTEKLSPWLKNSEQVLVLTCSYLSEYYGQRAENDEDMLLRALKTDKYSHPVHSGILEQPNTLKGIPAGVLMWCQMCNIPAVAYVCYSRTFQTDSTSVKLFSHLVSKLPFKLLKDKPNFTRASYSGLEVSSNVYM